MWYKRSNSVPSEPGTAPIPNGTVRRFHCTMASPDIIRSQGLLQSSARGIEGPKAIYSWPTYKDAKGYSRTANIVEFYTDPKRLEGPYAQYGDIKPNEIIGIHEPWHDRFRYCLENNISDEIMRQTGDPDYIRSADEIKKINGIKTAQNDFYAEPLPAQKDPWWRNGYLARGHSWTAADPDPDDKVKAKLPPPNPQDALWAFIGGGIKVVTAQDWLNKGGRGFTFVHDEVFGNDSIEDNVIRGRYDASRKVVSIVKTDKLAKFHSSIYRILERTFPRSTIMEF